MSVMTAPAAERRSRVHLPAGKWLDRAALLDELAALRRKTPGDAAFRCAAVTALQSALQKGRDEARKALEGGGSGRACAEALSDQIDDLLRVALELVTRWLAPHQGGEPTIVAVGGYGRGMLAPGSDIDLLFLLPNKPTPAVEKVVEALLYVLWDLKQKVGHATRTVDECLRQARADMTIRTTLIEARLIIGDSRLFETLQTRFDKEIVAKSASEFVAAKLAEREQRVQRAGASRYLVEPNVKEGKGGLRDLNTLFWIAKYVYRVRNPHDLIAAGLFSPREFALFRRCEEFLWSVRCRLHFLAGRAEERLSFDVQRPIARQLGYSTRAALAGAALADVERFMKH
ncbi:MAG TPA: nucleotidyltransferase domain-containing protein, partial [Roseiarcus sp.]|nr:nucleotidyltransferase domain-containing protein [Roseiarcus sp.]